MREVSTKSREALAESILKSGPIFVKAATEAFHAQFAQEYHRLRGYALEGQSTTMELQLKVVCCFDPTNQSVTVEATPKVSPRPGRTTVKIPANG